MECIVRPAQSADCDHLMGMIREIAEYHNLLDEVKINSQVLSADGFGGDPFYQCLVAELAPEQEGKQGQGIGKKLMSEVAKLALARGCVEMKFTVAEWNVRALAWYRQLGAQDKTEAGGWHCVELGGEALQRLAGDRR
ncbi:thialysine N-epsilon-acetyltransferase-like isoform X3 [Chrysemys picta bellii]|uniref:thialysine N-epsilon-acetyltransferase-like isoform X3 n=1 Tax=Chrysemys picta bellii TaxID=8478 RepID=UPI0003891A2E|nr:thialysine N-epsilon-acetyltransferase-like isoform X3 [Chrysemys picta bellii]